MKGWTRDQYDLAGYGLWVVGVLFFLASSIRSGDPLALVGSIMFLVGIVLVMVPMVNNRR